MKKILTILCMALFATAMLMNLQYALDGYGIKSMTTVHAAILALDDDSGTGTGTGDCSAGVWDKICYKVTPKNNSQYYFNCEGSDGQNTPKPWCPSLTQGSKSFFSQGKCVSCTND